MTQKLTLRNFAKVQEKVSNIFIIGRATKIRENYLAKRETLASDFCAFCNLSPEQIFDGGEWKRFLVIKNKFPYAVFESLTVLDHLLIIPRRHVFGLNEFSREEFDEFREILQKYEKLGYSIYARAPQNINKTVAHQHTHLIKTGGDFVKENEG